MTAPSLATVYRQHHAFVWRTLRCLGVADAAVDDAVQDVFLVAHRKLDAFEGRASLRTWLYEIARRVAWRHRQRAQADAVRSFELPDLDAALDLDDAVARAQALEIVRAFLDRLDEDKATVYVLAELGGLHGSEIAEDLGVNVNTVHARLRAARRDLERLLVRLRARDRASTLPRHDRIAPLLVREQPSAEQQRRSWAVLAAELGLGRAAPGWLGLGASKLAWIAGALAVPVVAVAVSVGVGRTEESPAASERVHVSSRVAVGKEASASPGPEAPREELEPAAAEPSSSAAADRPLLARSARPTSTASGVAKGDAPEAAGASSDDASPASTVPTADALHRELALVERIRSARLEDASQALALVRRYRGDHPQGALASEVAALEIEALCTTGDVAAARTAAERFAVRWPESSLHMSAVNPCEKTSR